MVRFARLHDFENDDDISCCLKDPIGSLEQLLSGDVVPGPEHDELPAPVWKDSKFKAGKLAEERHIAFWEEVILHDHPRKEFILENMRGMDPARYFTNFKGRFAGKEYDCNFPPSRQFRNNWTDELTSTGQKQEDWAEDQIKKDCVSGAVECLGKKGEVDPPYIVLPLTVEPLKPRLIHDARYLNLFNTSSPFTMGRVASVPEVAPRSAFLFSIDHKSGYHAFPFLEKAKGMFGFELKGKYYQPAAGVFGWCMLPEIYHLAHEALDSFASRHFGVPALTYLDDTFGSSMWNSELSMADSARWGARVTLWLNFLAGYTVSVKKSVLAPTQQLVWLGITINSKNCDFHIPTVKKEDFLTIISSALEKGEITIRQLERIAGKAISFMVAIGEAAMIYTRELFNTLRLVHSGKIAQSSFKVKISRKLERVLSVWIKFIQVFDGAPWMDVEHSTLRIETDASSRRWGGVLREDGESTISTGEEFNMDELQLHIEAKEALAITKVIEAIAEIRGWGFFAGKRIDAFIDNEPLVYSMKKGASRMEAVHAELEKLFWWKLEHNFFISGYWWGTKENFRADDITRTEIADDCRLLRYAFVELWSQWGPFQADLMASSVSAQCDLVGKKLPFYSRFFSPGCAGVNILAQSLRPGTYFCFPPKKMVTAVVAFLASRKAAISVVLITTRQKSGWLARVHGSATGPHPLPPGAVCSFAGETCAEIFEAWLLVL